MPIKVSVIQLFFSYSDTQLLSSCVNFSIVTTLLLPGERPLWVQPDLNVQMAKESKFTNFKFSTLNLMQFLKHAMQLMSLIHLLML